MIAALKKGKTALDVVLTSLDNVATLPIAFEKTKRIICSLKVQAAVACHSSPHREIISRELLPQIFSAMIANARYCCDQLTRIELEYCKLGDEATALLASMLSHCPKLTVLVLGGNNIGPKGATSIAENLHFLPNLEFLNLRMNCIGEDGALILAQHLHCLRHLCSFHLNFNETGAAGTIAVLKAAISMPKLTKM